MKYSPNRYVYKKYIDMGDECKDDPNCCPPAGSQLQSALDFRRKRMKQEIGFAVFTVIMTFSMWAILIGVALFSLYLLVKTLMRYVREKNSREQIRLIDSSSSTTSSNSISAGDDSSKYHSDNYKALPTKPSDLASHNLDRNVFLKNLNQKSESHKQMNRTLNKYFRKNYNRAAPDNIDQTVVLAEYDDW